MTKRNRPVYRVGIIGAGRQGTVHARGYSLNPATEVVAAADPDPENLEIFCKRFNCPGYKDYKEMLAREDIEISAPIVPVKANADAVVASAQAGVKAISCEKPLTASLEDADRMVEECRSRDVLFAAGLVPRNYPQHWQARDLINSGEIGEILSINLYDGNGQGGCHGINMALHFANDAEVDWLVGWVGSDPFSDGDPADESFDNPEIAGDPEKKGLGGYIRFANSIECFSHRRNTVRKGIEVVCSDGVFFSDFFNNCRLYKRDGSTLREVEGLFTTMSQPRNPDGSRTRDADGWIATTPGLKATIESLVEALDSGAKPKLTTGEDLRRCLETCIAMRESHRRDFVPVRLPLEDRNLKMYPVDARWNYKKEELGREWYMDQLAHYVQGKT